MPVADVALSRWGSRNAHAGVLRYGGTQDLGSPHDGGSLVRVLRLGSGEVERVLPIIRANSCPGYRCAMGWRWGGGRPWLSERCSTQVAANKGEPNGAMESHPLYFQYRRPLPPYSSAIPFVASSPYPRPTPPCQPLFAGFGLRNHP